MSTSQFDGHVALCYHSFGQGVSCYAQYREGKVEL